MKKICLFFGLLCVLFLVGCNYKCDCNCPCNINNNEIFGDAGNFCLDHGGTYSVVYHSEVEVNGECSFPSGIICGDDLILGGTCDYEANINLIDTEEKRLDGCNENVAGGIKNFENGKVIFTDWEDESEGGGSFVRNGVVHYEKNGTNWKVSVECIADFVDGSISVSYGDTDLD